MIGLGQKESTVHLIDYGLSKKCASISHTEAKGKTKFVGAVRYASLNAHKKLEQGRRDDLESIGLILIYLHKGSLPWQGVVARNPDELEKAVYSKKVAVSVIELCKELPGTRVNFISG